MPWEYVSYWVSRLCPKMGLTMVICSEQKQWLKGYTRLRDICTDHLNFRLKKKKNKIAFKKQRIWTIWSVDQITFKYHDECTYL